MAVATAPDGVKIQAKLVTITPKKANELLERNWHNRRINFRLVEQFAADMRAGNWQINGEAIKISFDGLLLDGQHRLHAVIESDMSVQMLVITGLPADSQETMDQGRPRSFADVLKLRGEHDYCVLSTAVRIVYLMGRDGVPFTGGRPQPSIKAMAATLAAHPGIRDSVKLAASLKRRWLPSTMFAAFHYLFTQVSADDATDFFLKVATGENLTADHPCYTLRERLIKEHHDPAGIHQRTKTAFIVKAWNAYRAGEPLQRLMWVGGGTSPDRFPQIDGFGQLEAAA